MLVLGVPIFPHGVHLIRRHVVPITDRLFRVKKQRGHVQAFSSITFLRVVRELCPQLAIDRVRGFRIVSGGLVLPLEHYRWWWRVNRWLGALVPSLCTEIQLVLVRRGRAAGVDSAAGGDEHSASDRNGGREEDVIP